jgi:Fic family protein
LLSLAHIEVQTLIDEWLEDTSNIDVCSSDFLCSIHREFYERVPENFLNIHDPETEKTIRMVPGELRKKLVTIGDHIPPPADTLDLFLKRFEEAYNPEKLLGHKKLMAVAASHHRLAWIHPFLDGNGRVTRLFSYAYMKKVKLESLGLWTISRGLARRSDDYLKKLAVADSSRRGDYDGRGNLSEKGLHDFCEFYFDVAADQISFMKELLQLGNFRDRIMGYVNLRSQNLIPGEETLRAEAKYALANIMVHGEVPRGEMKRITGLGERTARDLTSQLESEELVVSDSHRSPLRFNIPGKVVGYYFPALYPEGSI